MVIFRSEGVVVDPQQLHLHHPVNFYPVFILPHQSDIQYLADRSMYGQPVMRRIIGLISRPPATWPTGHFGQRRVAANKQFGQVVVDLSRGRRLHPYHPICKERAKDITQDGRGQGCFAKSHLWNSYCVPVYVGQSEPGNTCRRGGRERQWSGRNGPPHRGNHLMANLARWHPFHLFVCMFVCLSVHLSIRLSVSLSVCSSVSLPVGLFVCSLVPLSLCSSICLPVRSFNRLADSSSACSSVCLLLFSTLCSSVCLSAFLFVCPFISPLVPLFICLSIRSSVCWSQLFQTSTIKLLTFMSQYIYQSQMYAALF